MFFMHTWAKSNDFCCSFSKSCPTNSLWPMNCSTPDSSVLSFIVSWNFLKLMFESVMPSNHIILYHSPSPLAFNLSQHQGLFHWVLFASGGQSIGASASASVLSMNIQDWFPLGLTGLIFLQSKGFSRVFSNTTVQTYKFFSTQLSLQFSSHIHTWLLEKT